MTVAAYWPPQAAIAPGPPPTWRDVYDPYTEMPPQVREWTCSACSLDWVLRATGAQPDSTREQVVGELGYGDVCGPGVGISPAQGLCDAGGSQVIRVLGEHGLEAHQAWLGFDQVYEAAGSTTGMMSGAAWYHWVGLRGRSGANLWIANSAPGYQGVWDVLTRQDFQRLGGFSVVLLV